ncbi:MAG: hypothetical protein ACRDHS_13300 [Actinomycetota bacterium]
MITAAPASALDARHAEVVRLVSELEPSLSGRVITDAIGRAAPSRREVTQLLRHLAAEPEILSSGSTRAPLVVARLAAALLEAGATRIRLPRCALCGREGKLPRRLRTQRICGTCATRLQLDDCSVCGRRRRVRRRTPEGDAVCGTCHGRDPATWKPCAGCSRTRRANARTADGRLLCASCYKPPSEVCEACGKRATVASRRGGLVICRRCYRSPQRPCGGCGRTRRVARRATAREPDLCFTCYQAPGLRCTRCGEEAPTRGVAKGAPLCFRCQLETRLDELLAGPDGEVLPALLPLREAVLAVRSPRTGLGWLTRSPGARLLRHMASGRLPLTHESLDASGQAPSTEHLRDLLVASGALPPRDPGLARLERFARTTVTSLEHSLDRKQLRSFATWEVLRRARRRAERGHLSPAAVNNAKAALSEAVRFLAWLRSHGRSLDTCTQADVDLWCASGAKARRRIEDLLGWAGRRRIVHGVRVPKQPPRGAPRSLGEETRWAIARQLLTDDALDSEDRVAGALVLLYAQPVSRIAQLRTSDVSEADGALLLRLGRDSVVVPEPLSGLVRRLPRRRQAGVAGQLPSPEWLFPGRLAGRPIHPEQLRVRLNAIGIECRPGRNAALLQLGAEVPAAVLADLLGLHPTTAVRWVDLAGGDWTRYAAERSRSLSVGERR